MKKIILALMIVLMSSIAWGDNDGCPGTGVPYCKTVPGPLNVDGDLTASGDINCTDISCSGGLLLNGASAEGAGDLVTDDDSGNVQLHIDVSTGDTIFSSGLVEFPPVINSDGFRIPIGSSQSMQSFTFDPADVNTTTGAITESTHALIDGDQIELETSAADLPAGWGSAQATGTFYFVIEKTVNDFKISATSGGAAVIPSDQGSGTHTLREQILADKCMGIKSVSSTVALTTGLFSSITKPSTASTSGCIMFIYNSNPADAITIDGNGRFNGGVDYVLGTAETVIVGSGPDGGDWSVWGGNGAP